MARPVPPTAGVRRRSTLGEYVAVQGRDGELVWAGVEEFLYPGKAVALCSRAPAAHSVGFDDGVVVAILQSV
ncbi:hypothetical protein GCM10027569_38650 [Flindersiella endophytica]